ncbi:alpha/beta hydrolase family protein [Lysobacter cavernae]|uniref:Alpha/beta hydrolase family protein n=1 Tax=Lysobacter cavernae TaxID=1685901 RepID=A0ABV7RNE0_9GAMM
MLGIMLSVGTAVAADQPAAALDVQAFVKKDQFRTIKISPAGDYHAATLPLEDRTALVIRRRTDMAATASVEFGKHQHIVDFWWVNPERVLISMAYKIGDLEEPMPTGELYAIDADGGRVENLIGQRVVGRSGDTRIQPKKVEAVAAFLIDDLPDDDKNVIISVEAFNADPLARVERLNVYTGHRSAITLAPVRNARFTTDSQGIVRFARGFGADGINKLYYRKSDEASWQLINDEARSDRIELALGFSADDKVAYLQVEQASGPDAIVAMDVATGLRKELLRDDDSDPARVIYRPGSSVPIGAVFMDGKPRMAFFDDASPEARLYRSLATAFGGDVPFITSSTADGNLSLVETYGDRNPGDFFVFDGVAKKADYLISRRNWFNPATMAGMRPIALTARDGLPLKGYLTLPPGSDGKNLPMVVMPHGGPYGVRDDWGFSDEPQLLASAGYAVLQINFRGSSGYGRAFTQAGAREWGGKMQDDVTDATRWAIQQGIADAGRVCIYGASYGGYSALLGVAKEPDLYKCAAGYVGVYELPLMYEEDAMRSGSNRTYLQRWVGAREQLAEVSPTRMADRIKVPVFLAAGGEDQRAPIAHSKLMEKALRKASVPVETLYYDTEGHGFYVEEHQREYYSRLLAFLSRSLGGRVATTGGGDVAAAK